MAVTRTEPYIPASDPRFVWTAGADVQKLWRQYGWTPPSETRTPTPVPEKEA